MNKNIVVLSLLQLSCYIHGYNTLHVEILKNNIKNKQVINASRCDFRGAGDLLKGINVSGGQLSGAMFSMPTKKADVGGIISIPGQKTDLTGANFSKTSLVSTNFADTVLKKVNFAGADIQYANFTGADLTGAVFTNVQNAEFASFCGATMPDGSVCNGTSWTNKSKKVTLYCNCPKKK